MERYKYDELCNEINTYIEVMGNYDTLIDRLDNLREEFITIGRIHTDMMHIIELGEHLTVQDKVTIFDSLQELLSMRREVKSILKFYMLNKPFRQLTEHNTMHPKGGNDELYSEFNSVYTPKTSNTSKYAVRSYHQSDFIKDLMSKIKFTEKKLEAITIINTQEQLQNIRRC